jgi:DNA-binding beta-propeller fold protein YncE
VSLRASSTSVPTNVYVCDSGNNRVQIFDQTGKFLGLLADRERGTTETLDSGFDEPISVAVDPTTGRVIVADSGNNRIKVKFI